MIEFWRDVQGYEGIYQVSDLGRVKSLNYGGTGKEAIMKQQDNGNGYKFVRLSKKGEKLKHVYVHRLVAESWIDNPLPDMFTEINHIDENRSNNRVENLEWISHKDNLNYGHRTEKFAKTQSKQVLRVATGEVYNSTREAARITGFSQGNISNACRGVVKTAYGSEWRYI
jgi:hypothetical protein